MLRFSCGNKLTCEDVMVMFDIEIEAACGYNFTYMVEYHDYGTGFYVTISDNIYTCVENGIRYISDEPIYGSHLWMTNFAGILEKIKKKYPTIGIRGWINVSRNNESKVICYNSPVGRETIDESIGFLKRVKTGFRAYPISKSWFHYSYNTWLGEDWACVTSPRDALEYIRKTNIEAIEELNRQWKSVSSELDFFDYVNRCNEYYSDIWPVYCNQIDFLKKLTACINTSRTAKELIKRTNTKEKLDAICAEIDKHSDGEEVFEIDGGSVTHERIYSIIDSAASHDVVWRGGFVKVYTPEVIRDEIIKSFLIKHKELHEKRRDEIIKHYSECDIRSMPVNISRKNIKKDETGFIINCGSLTMEVYGRPTPCIYDFIVVLNEAFDFVIKKYGEVKYEGAITISDDDTINYSVVGNVKDYTFTKMRIENELKEV